jgi:hypothetical protein
MAAPTGFGPWESSDDFIIDSAPIIQDLIEKYVKTTSGPGSGYRPNIDDVIANILKIVNSNTAPVIARINRLESVISELFKAQEAEAQRQRDIASRYVGSWTKLSYDNVFYNEGFPSTAFTNLNIRFQPQRTALTNSIETLRDMTLYINGDGRHEINIYDQESNPPYRRTLLHHQVFTAVRDAPSSGSTVRLAVGGTCSSTDGFMIELIRLDGNLETSVTGRFTVDEPASTVGGSIVEFKTVDKNDYTSTVTDYLAYGHPYLQVTMDPPVFSDVAQGAAVTGAHSMGLDTPVICVGKYGLTQVEVEIAGRKIGTRERVRMKDPGINREAWPLTDTGGYTTYASNFGNYQVDAFGLGGGDTAYQLWPAHIYSTTMSLAREIRIEREWMLFDVTTVGTNWRDLQAGMTVVEVEAVLGASATNRAVADPLIGVMKGNADDDTWKRPVYRTSDTSYEESNLGQVIGDFAFDALMKAVVFGTLAGAAKVNTITNGNNDLGTVVSFGPLVGDVDLSDMLNGENVARATNDLVKQTRIGTGAMVHETLRDTDEEYTWTRSEVARIRTSYQDSFTLANSVAWDLEKGSASRSDLSGLGSFLTQGEVIDFSPWSRHKLGSFQQPYFTRMKWWTKAGKVAFQDSPFYTQRDQLQLTSDGYPIYTYDLQLPPGVKVDGSSEWWARFPKDSGRSPPSPYSNALFLAGKLAAYRNPDNGTWMLFRDTSIPY